MIYCPKCGTANRDGSRFCNECGERLAAHTQLKCPQCGAMNPVQNVFCKQCGGAIVSLPKSEPSAEPPPTIKGLSLPTKSPMGEDKGETAGRAEPEMAEDGPAWLRGLRASMSAESQDDELPSSEDAMDVPDWLKDLRASLPEEPELEPSETDEPEQVPEWLGARGPEAPEEAAEAPPEPEAELEPVPEPEIEPEEAEEGIPEWLMDHRLEVAPQPELEDGPDVEEEIPEWLTDLWPEALAPAAAAGAEQEPAPGPEIEEPEVPDWLAELQPKAAEEEAPLPAPEAASEPEIEAEPEPAPRVEEKVEGEIPSWLAELGREAPEAELEEEAEPEAEAEPALEMAEDAPDWLAELRTEPPEAELDEEAEPETEAEPALETAEDIPDWLAELRAEPPEADLEPDEETEVVPGLEPEIDEEEDRAPDWLVGVSAAAAAAVAMEPAEVPETEAEPPSEEVEAEPPTRLADLRPEAPEAELGEEAEPGVEEEAALEVAEGEVPDWLAELGAETPEVRLEPEEKIEEMPGPAPEIEDEDTGPDWLAGVPAAVAAAAVLGATQEPEPEPEMEDEELPDWLAELRAEAPEEELAEETEPELEAEPELEEEELPDWLAGLRAEAPEAELAEETEPELEAEPELEEEELPDWLAELAAEAPEAELAEETKPEFEAEPELEEEELPDWLAELRAEAPEAALAEEEELEAVPEAEPEIEEEDKKPDWLVGVSAAALAAATRKATREPEAEEEESPAWLDELAPAKAEGTAAEEVPAWWEEQETPDFEEIPAAEAMPEWIAGMRPKDAEVLPGEEEMVVEGELPDWLVPSGADEDDTLAQADIPEWLLALKPRELRKAEGEEVDVLPPLPEEKVEETGILAGLQGILPIEMLIAQPRVATPPGEKALVRDTPESRLFSEIVARPPSVAPQAIAREKPGRLDQVVRWIIYLILIGVVAALLLIEEPLLVRDITPVPAVDGLYTEIDALGSNAAVLVAFDYDPASSGEMDAVAQPILAHLMEQQARIVAISLLPAGPPTAQNLLDTAAADQSGYTYGEQYANLGYLPGEAIAVRLLGQSLETAVPRDMAGTPLAELAALQGINTLADFELIIELAATQDSVRWWIEQGSMPHDIPIGAGTSASVDPLVRPYYETEPQQLQGIVGGIAGTAMYETLLGDEDLDGSTAARLNAQLAGAILLVLVILIGNVVYFTRRGARRKS